MAEVRKQNEFLARIGKKRTFSELKKKHFRKFKQGNDASISIDSDEAIENKDFSKLGKSKWKKEQERTFLQKRKDMKQAFMDKMNNWKQGDMDAGRLEESETF